MCSRLRGHMPVYPNGSKVTLQLALIISYGPRDACCHCSLVLPEGRMWTSSLMQDFPLFLQTWSLYQLASTFENAVPGGLYGDPFSFYHIKGFISGIAFFFSKLRSSPASGSYHKYPAGRHSPGLCLNFKTRPLPPHLSHMKYLLIKIIYLLGICATGHVWRAAGHLWGPVLPCGIKLRPLRLAISMETVSHLSNPRNFPFYWDGVLCVSGWPQILYEDEVEL